jgi:hypothetical protein
MKTDALLSGDRKYRYWLTRIWDESKPMGCVIGVNPSKADEKEDDPTIRKDIGFLTRFGFGGLLKLNVGAYRSTDPRNWRKALDPIGDPLNSARTLAEYVGKFGVKLTIAAWGKNGNYFLGRCNAIRREIPGLMCLGTNPDGTPRHTLMLAYSTPLQSFHDHGEGQNECTACDRWAGRVGN